VRQSEQIGELAAALAVAQGKMEPPKKDKLADVKSKKGEGSSYQYHYSDLASLIDALRAPFAENGLAHFQSVYMDEGQMMIETRIIHASGQWIASQYPLMTYSTPQEQGSAITYARRYALGALAGLAPEDDDGKAAQEGQRVEPKSKKAPDMIGESIEDVASQIAMIAGGNVKEIISRASAFYGSDHPQNGEPMSDSQRWESDIPFGKDVAAIKDLSRTKSEKWKAKTLVNLRARLDALHKGSPDDPHAHEPDDFRPSDDDVPF